MNKTEKELENLIISSPKVVGIKQVLRSIASDELRCVVLSEDVEAALKEKLIVAATSKNLEIFKAKSMIWLGKISEIDVKAATVGILKHQSKE